MGSDNFNKQYKTLYHLGNGWYDGDQGDKFTDEKLDEFKKLFDENFNAKEPYVYPGFDGEINFEWTLPEKENEFSGLVVDININTLESQLFYYKDNSTDPLDNFDLTSRFNLSTFDGWDILNKTVNEIFKNDE